MSFQNKDFWMPREAGCLTDGEICYGNPTRIEPKRSHQWFMDSTGTELFSNKKQAIEAHYSRPVLGISHTNVPQWNSTSSFQSHSGESADCLFGSEPVRTVNLVDRSIPSVNCGSLNVERSDFKDQYNNASLGLSMYHFEDPIRFNLGGIRKVTVNHVMDSGSGLSTSMELSYGRGDNISLSMGTTFDKRNNKSMSVGPNNINLDKNTISMGRTFGKADFSVLSMGHTFNKGEENYISMGYNYSRRNGNISLMGQSFDKEDGNYMSIGQFSERREGNVMSMSSCNKKSKNFLSIGQIYDQANKNFISVGSSYNEGSDNPIGQTYDKTNENFISVGSSYNKGSHKLIGMPLTYDEPDSNINLVSSTQDKGDSVVLSKGHNFDRGERNTMSFGGYQDEPETNSSWNIISGYDLLMGTQKSAQASLEPSLATGTQNSAPASQESSSLLGVQSSAPASQEPSSLIGAKNSAPASQKPRSLIGAHNSAQASQEPSSLIDAQNSAQAPKEPNLLMGTQNTTQASQEPSQPNLLEPNVDSTVNNIPVINPGTVTAPKRKAAKKDPANNFPSSVKSLLSTGMLDGILVKYVSWSREKVLKGTIKGAAYLCGCSNCNYNKALNAYEFEHHANCKTKHPNSHIYLENGKTIYEVVQELKSTSQVMLFDAIQNVIGSQINQKNYRTWKASYEAATRELQRIYGNVETVSLPSSG